MSVCLCVCVRKSVFDDFFVHGNSKVPEGLQLYTYTLVFEVQVYYDNDS